MTYILTCTDHTTGKTNTLQYTDEEMGWAFRAAARLRLLNGGTYREQGRFGSSDWKIVGVR